MLQSSIPEAITGNASVLALLRLDRDTPQVVHASGDVDEHMWAAVEAGVQLADILSETAPTLCLMSDGQTLIVDTSRKCCVLGKPKMNVGLMLLQIQRLPDVDGVSRPLAALPPFADDGLAAVWDLADLVARTEMPRTIVLRVDDTEHRLPVSEGRIRAGLDDDAVRPLVDAVLAAARSRAKLDVGMAPWNSRDLLSCSVSPRDLLLAAAPPQPDAGGSVFSRKIWPLALPDDMLMEQIRQFRAISHTLDGFSAGTLAGGEIVATYLTPERKTALKVSSSEDGFTLLTQP